MVMVARNTHRGELIMKAELALPMALLLALSVPALAKNDKGNQGNGNGNGGNVRGAPGPLVGAGLPVLLIGGGIYWIVRRQKQKKKQARFVTRNFANASLSHQFDAQIARRVRCEHLQQLLIP